jgi:UDP-glucose 4-epimerase
MELALTSKRAEGDVFLVADPEPISVAEMIAAMRDGLGRSAHLFYLAPELIERLTALVGKQAEWERLSGSLVVNASKLQGIGWSPHVSTRQGLAMMMNREGRAD